MIKKETKEGFVWIGIGVILCILALQFDLGTFHAPGPGFLPILTGLFISAMGLTMVVAQAISKHRSAPAMEPGHSFRIGSWPRLVYTMALLLGYIILLEPVGFVLMTFLLMFGLFFDRGRRNYGWSLFFSVGTALMSYLIFEVWLRCQLPRGLFPWW